MMKILRILLGLALIVMLMAPSGLGAKGIDPRKVSVLYAGDPYPGVSPYLSMREDAFILVAPIQCHHHGGGVTALVDIHRYMRLYMPRNRQECLDKYDVIILSDAWRPGFKIQQLQWFKDGVTKQGQGLIMVAGQDSFGASSSRPAASWDGSIIEEILPITILAPTWHHNLIGVAVTGIPIKMRIMDYTNEFISSLPYEPLPRYTNGGYHNCQLVGQKQGSDLLASFDVAQLNDPPCYVTWETGEGRTFAMLHDWTGATEFSKWPYYRDYAINLMLYLAQRPLPTEPVIVHEYREQIHKVAIGRSMLLSLIYFVESFGGNPRQIDEEIVTLDSMVAGAGDQYLDHEFSDALASSETVIEKLKQIEELAVKIKNQALFWVYLVEWLSVTAVSLLSGFVVWSLMIRRKLYREVEVTRLRQRRKEIESDD